MSGVAFELDKVNYKMCLLDGAVALPLKWHSEHQFQSATTPRLSRLAKPKPQKWGFLFSNCLITLFLKRGGDNLIMR